MNNIKSFNELNESDNYDENGLVKGPFPEDTSNILWKLEEGFAILVTKENLEEFYKAVSYYDWIEYEPKLDPEVCPPVMYWVLIGRKILHTDKPKFGGYDFEVYEPKF